MSKKLKIDYGTCWPDEYDWETQFAEALNGAYGFVTVDAGKLRGVALAYKELCESKRLVFVGLATEEARKFYESDLSREELIHKIDEFLEEKNT